MNTTKKLIFYGNTQDAIGNKKTQNTNVIKVFQVIIESSKTCNWWGGGNLTFQLSHCYLYNHPNHNINRVTNSVTKM